MAPLAHRPPRIDIVEATFGHAEELAETLRAGDAMEIAALGFTPLEALDAVLVASHDARTALVTHGRGAGPSRPQVAAMWGYTAPTLLGDSADLWAFSGHPADAYPLPFLKASRQYVDELQGKFARLRALVALDYAAAVRWLRWLGFQDGDIETYGGRKFMRVCRYGR